MDRDVNAQLVSIEAKVTNQPSEVEYPRHDSTYSWKELNLMCNEALESAPLKPETVQGIRGYFAKLNNKIMESKWKTQISADD
jgi:hypothetical protein